MQPENTQCPICYKYLYKITRSSSWYICNDDEIKSHELSRCTTFYDNYFRLLIKDIDIDIQVVDNKTIFYSLDRSFVYYTLDKALTPQQAYDFAINKLSLIKVFS